MAAWGGGRGCLHGGRVLVERGCLLTLIDVRLVRSGISVVNGELRA